MLRAEIERLAREKYQHTELLRQVTGIGPVTSLAYVLTLETPLRFAKSRDVGPYLGLVPAQEDSWWQSTAIRHQQGGRQDVTQAAGGQCPLHPRTVRASLRFTTIWNEAV